MSNPKKSFLRQVYEKIDVNIKVAILVFGIFLILTLASALAILYANGGRATQNGFVETGSLRVITEPTDVTVYLDETIQNLNNKQVNGLVPGKYTLRVSKDGFIDWTKEIEIKQGLVEEQFIRLFPEDLNINQFSQTNIDKVVFDSTGTYAYYSVIESEIGSDIGIWRSEIANPNPLNIFDNTENTIKLTNITPEISEIKSTDYDYELIPSPDNRRLIIKTDQHYIIDADRYSEPLPENTIENIVNYDFSDLNWFRNSNSVVTVNNGLLAETQLNNGITNVITYSSGTEPIYSISENLIYFYDQAKNTLKLYNNGTSSEVKLNNRQIEGEITSLHTNIGSQKNLYYQNSDNEIYYLNLDRSYSANISALLPDYQNVSIQEISSDGNAAIINMVTNESSEIGIFTVEEVPANNTFNTQFNSYSKELNRLQFSPSGINVVILNAENELIVSDLEFENQISLLTANEDETIELNQSFRLNRDDNQMFILLTEKSGENNSATSKNLYVINLEQTN